MCLTSTNNLYQPLVTSRVTCPTVSSPVTCYLRHAAVATAAPVQLSPRHRTPAADGNTAAAGAGRGGAGVGRGTEGVLSIHMCGLAAATSRVTAALPQIRDYQSVATDPQTGCDTPAYGALLLADICMTA